MTTDERIRRILRGARDDLAANLAEPEPARHPARVYREWDTRRSLAEDGIVDLATARWLGMDVLSHSESTMTSRALQAGSSRGLWTLQRWNGRTWGLQLRGDTDGQ